MRISWKGFLQWSGARESDYLNEAIYLLKDLVNVVSESALYDFMSNASYIRIVLHLLEQYLGFLRNDNGSTSGF